MSKTAESVLKSARENNEPVFVLRAKDMCSLQTLNSYYNNCHAAGCEDEHLGGLVKIIIDFDEWRDNNPEQIKVPD